MMVLGWAEDNRIKRVGRWEVMSRMRVDVWAGITSEKSEAHEGRTCARRSAADQTEMMFVTL